MANLREDGPRRNTRTHTPKTASGEKTPNFRCAGPGLYYDRARYFDALSGKFANLDPSGFAVGDANLFRYVGNDSSNLFDVTGLQIAGPPVAAPIGIGVGAGGTAVGVGVGTVVIGVGVGVGIGVAVGTYITGPILEPILAPIFYPIFDPGPQPLPRPTPVPLPKPGPRPISSPRPGFPYPKHCADQAAELERVLDQLFEEKYGPDKEDTVEYDQFVRQPVKEFMDECFKKWYENHPSRNQTDRSIPR